MKAIILCDGGKPEKVLPLCAKHNFGIEIQGFYDPNRLGGRKELINQYKNLLPKGIAKYLHAPFWDLCLGSANEKIAEVTRFYFDYAYGVAEELGCVGITVHHGFVPNTSHPANWIKRSAAFWESFFGAHPGEIRIFMENLCERDAEVIAGVVDAYGHERLAINLDIGHAHCVSDLDVTDWIERLAGRIAYVHLHQNGGLSDEHLGLKKGNIPIKDVLSSLEKHVPEAVWALECNTDDMEESIALFAELGYIGS